MEMPNHQHSSQRRQPTQKHEPSRRKSQNQKAGFDAHQQGRRIRIGLAADLRSYSNVQSAVCGHGAALTHDLKRRSASGQRGLKLQPHRFATPRCFCIASQPAITLAIPENIPPAQYRLGYCALRSYRRLSVRRGQIFKVSFESFRPRRSNL